MIHSNPTETRIASIVKDEQDIIIITMKDCGVMDEYDVLDVNLVLKAKSRNKPAYKLLDARANWSMNKKAKESAQLENSASKTAARAIVVSSEMKGILLNFLQNFSKSIYPQKMFSNKEDAYNWLLSLKNK